jgi:hypothetical protein
MTACSECVNSYLALCYVCSSAVSVSMSFVCNSAISVSFSIIYRLTTICIMWYHACFYMFFVYRYQLLSNYYQLLSGSICITRYHWVSLGIAYHYR